MGEEIKDDLGEQVASQAEDTVPAASNANDVSGPKKTSAEILDRAPSTTSSLTTTTTDDNDNDDSNTKKPNSASSLLNNTNNPSSPSQSKPGKSSTKKLPERSFSASSSRSIIPETIPEATESSTASSAVDDKRENGENDNASDVATSDDDLKGLAIDDDNDVDENNVTDETTGSEQQQQPDQTPVDPSSKVTTNGDKGGTTNSADNNTAQITTSATSTATVSTSQVPAEALTQKIAQPTQQNLNLATISKGVPVVNPSKPSRFKVVQHVPQTQRNSADPQQQQQQVVSKQKTSPNKPNHVANAGKSSRFKIVPQQQGATNPLAATGSTEITMNTANGPSKASNSPQLSATSIPASQQEMPPKNISIPTMALPHNLQTAAPQQQLQYPFVSDSASLGSIPSAVDSMSVPAPQGVQAGTGPTNPTTFSDLNQPPVGILQGQLQQIEQGTTLDQPLLVAVPYQQQSQPQHQAMLYQLPGVVTLPVGSNGQLEYSPMTPVEPAGPGAPVESQSLPDSLLQPGLQQQPQGQDQVYGMISTIPVVKLQGVTTQFVKKRKGRFKFLRPGTVSGEQTAIDPNESAVSASSVTPVQSNLQQQSQNGVPNTIATQVPGQSMVSSISAVTGPVQTLEGVGAKHKSPAVQKKGRFVVTKVNDSGAISGAAAAQPQQLPQVPDLPTSLPQAQVPNQQQTNHIRSGQSSTQNNMEAQHQQQLGSDTGSLQNNVPSNIEIQYQQPMALVPPSGFATQPSVAFVQSQNYANPMAPQYFAIDPTMNQAQQQYIATHLQGNLQEPNPSTVFAQTLTPPPTPGAPDSRGNSPQRTQPTTITVPPIPMPKTPQPQNGEKPKLVNGATATNPAKRKPAVPPRATKSGQGLEKTSPGLGKVFYFLDQMKAEVTDADRTIKTLQTDMKFLREKNKEWEAKNREMEKNLKEERKLREAAEARLLDLRRKLRDAKIDLSAIKKPVSVNEKTSDKVEDMVELGDGKNGVAGKSIATHSTTEKSTDSQPKLSGPKNGTKAGSSLITPQPQQSIPSASSNHQAANLSPVTQAAPKAVVPASKPPSGAAQGAPKAVVPANKRPTPSNPNHPTPQRAQSPTPQVSKQPAIPPSQTNPANVEKTSGPPQKMVRSASITQNSEASLTADGAKPRSGSIGSPGHRRTQSHAPEGERLALDRKNVGYGVDSNLKARNNLSGSNLDFDPLRPSLSQSDIPTDVVISSVPPPLSLDQPPIPSNNMQPAGAVESFGQNPFDSYVPVVPVTFASNSQYQGQPFAPNHPAIFDLNQSETINSNIMDASPLLSTGIHPFYQQPMMVVQSQQPLLFQQVQQTPGMHSTNSQQWAPPQNVNVQQQQQAFAQHTITSPQEPQSTAAGEQTFDGFLT